MSHQRTPKRGTDAAPAGPGSHARDADIKKRLGHLAETLPDVTPEDPGPGPILDSKGKPIGQGLPPRRAYLNTTCAAHVKPEEVRYLWGGRVPATRLTFFIGMPDRGKSTLMSFVTSVVTTGGLWPDGAGRAERGTVLIAQAEESQSEDIAVRLERFGADTDKVHYLNDVTDENGNDRTFSVGKDCAPGGPLESKLDEYGDVRAVILDPLDAFLGNTSMRSAEEVYAALQKLKTMAERRRFAAIVVGHLNKSDEQSIMHRLVGSQAFGALARALWFVSEDPNDPSRRLLSYVKGNTRGLNRRPLAFSRDGEDGPLVFDAELPEMKAELVNMLLQRNLKRDAAQAARPGPKPGASAEAEPLILAALAGGPKLRAELARAVVSEAIKVTSFNKAVRRLEEDGKVFRKELPTSKRCVLIGLVEHFPADPPRLNLGLDGGPQPPANRVNGTGRHRD